MKTQKPTQRTSFVILASIWFGALANAGAAPSLIEEAFPGVPMAQAEADYIPIGIQSARTWGNPNGVEVIFTEPVNPVTATNTANYGIAPGVTIEKAEMGSNPWTVKLTTSSMADATLHTLVASNVKDLATPANTIAPASSLPILKAQGLITRKLFNGITGTWPASLTNHAKFPHSPDVSDWQFAFEAPVNIADNYGQQMPGHVCPPVTGDYQFFLASDGAGLLYLSSDASSSSKTLIASVPDATGNRQWNKYASQASGYFRLEAGRVYYIEALMAESNGNDWLAVTWRMRGMPTPADGDSAIPGGFLSSIAPSGPIGIVRGPQDVSAAERGTATFTVEPSGTPLYQYQWLKNGFEIPGANARTYTTSEVSDADNNSRFRVRVSNAFSASTSSEAKLTVVRDTIPPSIVRVSSGPTLDRVLISFSEPVTASTAMNAANYTLGGELSVLGARLMADQTNVVLSTSQQTPGLLYTLSIAGITDAAVAHNVINVSSNFTAWTLHRGYARREVFSNISGSFVSDLTGAADFPNNPDAADYVAQSEAPQNIGGNRGERLIGLLLTPITGFYRFYFYSADQGVLYLSPDESPANKAQIAWEPNWNYHRTWVSTDRRNAAAPENRSAPVFLQAGMRYYFEALMKDQDGDNRLGFTWQLPGAPTPVNGDPPIGPGYLASYADPTGAAIAISQQPQPAVAVPESSATNLSVAVTTTYSPVLYQWQRNGVDISGANSAAYVTPRLLRGDAGTFRCIVGIPGATLTSAETLLTVLPDSTAPHAVSAATLVGSTNLTIAFSELLDLASSTNVANYRLSIGGLVSSASLQADGQTVVLGITGLSFTNYNLFIKNVKDYAGNLLQDSSNLPVFVNRMENTDVGIPGDPAIPGSTLSSGSGNFDVYSGGSDIWNSRDGFHFVYQQLEGDFDARVRVARLDATSQYSFAGLHVRESLYPGSRGLKVVVARPDLGNGYHVGYRANTDGGSANWPGHGTWASSGSPIPNAWIRLTRTNDLFTAWRGTNGVDWTAFAQMSMSYTGKVCLGLATCPVNNGAGKAITAWYRGFTLSPVSALPAPIDLLLKVSAAQPPTFALNDVYQAVPTAEQILQQPANPDRPASFTLQIQNDGTIGQPALLRAVESGDPGWTASYSMGGSNITTFITNASGFALANVTVGATEQLQVELLPGSRIPGRSTRNILVKAATDRFTSSSRDAVMCVALNEESFQPDLQLRRADDVVHAGIGIYNSTGADQTKSITAVPGTTAIYPMRLVNDGNLTNAFAIAGESGGGLWRVKYFDAVGGGSDITDRITSGTLGISLLPGASWEFRAEVTVSPFVTSEAANTILVTALAAANPARTDTVKLITRSPIVSSVAQSATLTTDTDFERGTRVGTTYGGNQLTLSQESVTWPFIWVPNSDQGSVSKVDVRTGWEVARYRVAPANVTSQPSRTTIDQQGNCWVANRQCGTMVKIGLLESGNYVDRNENGVPDTSTDLNHDGDISGSEILAWGQDECVLYEVVAIPGKEGTYTPGTFTGGYANNYWNPGPRGVAVDYNGNVWLGTHDAKKYYYIDGSTARILLTNDLTFVDHTPYGAVVDANGIVWSSGYRESGVSTILRLDPKDNSMYSITPGFHTYGLGIDRNNHLFVSGHQEAKLARIDVVKTNMDWTIGAGGNSRGIAVTDDGDVWVASSGDGNIWRFSNDGVLKGKIAVGPTPCGVSVDSAGKVWVVNKDDEVIRRIDPGIGSVGAVDLTKRIIAGGHYGYSDMTGIIARSTTGRFGTWTVIQDAAVRYAQWGVIAWRAVEPAGDNISVRVRSSEDQSAWSAWEAVTNGRPLSATRPGRYLQVEVSLRARLGATLPMLNDLSIEPLPQRTADVASAQVVTPAIATNDHLVTWTISATNKGPTEARGVYIANVLPAAVTVSSITVSHGAISVVPGGLLCALGDLKTGSNFTMTVTALVTAPGTLVNDVVIGSYETDPVPANNSSSLSTPAMAIPCAPIPAGLVGWWPGDGAPMDMADTNHGLLAGGATFAPGRVGLAFSLNGSGAYVDLHRRSPGTRWSLEAWVKFSATLGGRRVIIGTEADCKDWALVANNGELGVNVGKNGCATIYSSGVFATNGTWYHVVGTCDGTNASIYVNGELKNTGTVDRNYLGSSSGLRIGSGVCCGEYMAGLVDEPSMYDRALTLAEVLSLFDARTSGKCRAVVSPVMMLSSSGGGLRLSWPVAATGFHLESSSDLETWVPWTGAAFVPQGDQLLLQVPTTDSMRFFRLVSP